MDKKSQKVSLLMEAQQLRQQRPDDHMNDEQNKPEKGVAPEENEQEIRRKRYEDNNFMTVMKTSALSVLQSKEKTQEKRKSLSFNWSVPNYILDMDTKTIFDLQNKYNVIIEGEDILPLIETFKDMQMPEKILKVLKKRNIKKPTPIQMQGIPHVLMGRDMICIAPSGTGKTLVFMLPALILGILEEIKLEFVFREGPVALILVPSHELAIQTFDNFQEYCQSLKKEGFPELRCMICIGGMDISHMQEQLKQARDGVHFIIGTPGRVSEMITKKRINLHLCRYVVLDEGDRMLDIIFETEITNIFNNIEDAHQTLLFSSTMPNKVQQFAKMALFNPICINIGRAGSVSLNVVQDVEYVKSEQKLVYLLQCLQKTAPPVMIFCDKIQEVEDIHEFLMIKGVEVCSLHGGKTQEERTKSFRQFKNGEKQVIVATDLAAKGLDFKDIKHVINFDMPKDIESYVHRIGRCGRLGTTGRASTFINKSQDTSILCDLKQLLIESKQHIPPCLHAISLDEEFAGGCGFCGGLGHRMSNCPKLEMQKMKALAASQSQNQSTGKEYIQQYLDDDEEEDNAVKVEQIPYNDKERMEQE